MLTREDVIRIARKYSNNERWTALYMLSVDPDNSKVKNSQRLMREIDEHIEDCSNERKDCADLEMLKAYILNVPLESL